MDVLLVCSREPLNPDMGEMAGRMAAPAVRQSLASAPGGDSISSVLQLLSMQFLDETVFQQVFPGTGTLNSDRFPYLEYHAPQDFFTQRTAAIYTLDERLRPRNHSRLLVAGYLNNHPLTISDIGSLLRRFTPPHDPKEASLMASLAYPVLSAQASAPEPVLRLARDAFLRYGAGSLLGRARVFEQATADKKATKEDWKEYFDFQAELLAKTTSVFTNPDTTRFAAVAADLVKRYPDEAPAVAKKKLRIYRALGFAPAAGTQP
jgi:hypothetical protein